LQRRSQKVSSATFVVVQHGDIVATSSDINGEMPGNPARKSLPGALTSAAAEQGHTDLNATGSARHYARNFDLRVR
jgi:hypothetical protein